VTLLSRASSIDIEEGKTCTRGEERRAFRHAKRARKTRIATARRGPIHGGEEEEEGKGMGTEGFRGFSANVSGKPAEHVHQRFQSDSAVGHDPSASLALTADFARAME